MPFVFLSNTQKKTGISLHEVDGHLTTVEDKNFQRGLYAYFEKGFPIGTSLKFFWVECKPELLESGKIEAIKKEASAANASIILFVNTSNESLTPKIIEEVRRKIVSPRVDGATYGMVKGENLTSQVIFNSFQSARYYQDQNGNKIDSIVFTENMPKNFSNANAQSKLHAPLIFNSFQNARSYQDQNGNKIDSIVFTQNMPKNFSNANAQSKLHAPPGFLVKHFGPSFLGTRGWLFLSVLFLLSVALVGGFAVVPLSAVVLGLVIALKTGALIAFLASVGMGIKAVIDDYAEKAKNDKEYFWLPYLWDKLTKDFFQWLLNSPPGNFVKFLLGFLLLAALIGILVCVCCPAIGIVIPGITVAVSFIGSAFEGVSLFAGSWIFTAAFLGIGTMLAYDVLCRVLDGLFGSLKPRDNSYHAILSDEDPEFGEELTDVLDVEEKTGDDLRSNSVVSQVNKAVNRNDQGTVCIDGDEATDDEFEEFQF